jgi:hypothetical protein
MIHHAINHSCDTIHYIEIIRGTAITDTLLTAHWSPPSQVTHTRHPSNADTTTWQPHVAVLARHMHQAPASNSAHPAYDSTDPSPQ